MTSIMLLSAEEVARCCPVDEESGFGALRTDQGNLPLKLLSVRARITGLVAETTLRQTYVNTLGVPLEATYIFPLPPRAAVSRFRFEVGERIIEGELKERGEARRVYQQAMQDGHRAAITEEERPGVFTMRVGNLMPGEEATVHLTLNGPLPFSEGEATYRFPLVVAPRYIPGSALHGASVGAGTALDTNAVPDASRISPPVLLPGFPNPVRLSVEVSVDGGLPLRSLRSSLHSVLLEQESGRKTVRIQPGERLNRDFVLRLGLASGAVQSEVTIHPDPDHRGEGTFQLTLLPPRELPAGVRPRDVVFVLDRSGSMGGWKMIAARRACARMLDTLTDRDRFSVLAFDTSVERPDTLSQSGLIPATNRNRFRAVEYLGQVEARGGTEMARPLEQAVDDLLELETGGRDRILILITDGQVGNEDQILRTLGARLRQLRVFTLGIDRAVNEGFLTRLAEIGGGGCEIVESENRLDDVMDSVHRRIGTPLLTGLRLQGTGGLTLESETLTPSRLPDLFAGTPVRIQGRYRGNGSVRVSARDAHGHAWEEDLFTRTTTNAAVTKVWARAQVRALEDSYAINGGSTDRIVALSLRYQVLCRFTSFVAVDRSEVVNRGGQVHQVTQAVESPEGWESGAAFASLSAAPMPSCAPPPPSGGDPFGSGSACFGAADPFCAPADGPTMRAGLGGDPFSAPAPSRPPRLSRRASGEGRAKAKRRGASKKPKKQEERSMLRSLMDKVTGKAASTPPSTPADSESRASSSGPGFRDELQALLDGLGDTSHPAILGLLANLRLLVERLEREGGEGKALTVLRELVDRLTQALSAGAPSGAEGTRLVEDARTTLRSLLKDAPVGRGQSFWF